jgi:formylglycine-generating enzyme required for sulfatase activity
MGSGDEKATLVRQGFCEIQRQPSGGYISWEDVQEFTKRVNRSEGTQVYRLPTEAEWEYACRAGTTTRWSFGDHERQLKDYAWYRNNAWDIDEKYAHAVGTKLPNPWGLYDMHGNVWEWTMDWYSKSYYNSSPGRDPSGPTMGSGRVVRGGSFSNYFALNTRSANRNYYGPSYRNNSLGARLLRTQ